MDLTYLFIGLPLSILAACAVSWLLIGALYVGVKMVQLIGGAE